MSVNILIIKPSSLGDIVHGLQVAQSIREQLPDCHISWVVRERFAPLVQLCETVDEAFIFYRKGGVKAFYQLVQTLRQQSFDYVLDFQGLARSGLMTYFAHSTHKFGRSDAREFARLAYHACAPLPRNDQQSHAIDILLQFLPLMELKAELQGKIRFQPKSVIDIDVKLLKKPYVFMAPNSRQPGREWWGFVPLTEHIVKTYPHISVVWDSHRALNNPHFCPHARFFNTTGKTSIHDMIGLVSQAALVIANDSGPLHLAAALGKPVVALLGPTSARHSGPYPLNKPSHYIIQAPHGDLRQLSVESVYNTVARALSDISPMPETFV